MGKTYDGIDDRLADWLRQQAVFFVATAPLSPGGHPNISPKGLAGSFAVLDRSTVGYLDFTGSGVETIAHLRENGRIVVMCCAFEGPPRIVRLHGRGEVVLPDDSRFPDLVGHFPAAVSVGEVGVRAIILVAVERAADSCGYGVPLLHYEGERALLGQWVDHKGPDGIAAYQATHNATSIDGLPGLS
ncbi:MAG: pyridoxamine 5'-phosphate oxidase family protein [Mycobacteriales bacterium]